jgi:D-alanine-D-alanine ligase
MSKLKVALIFGGNSSEHDVSKRSAKNYYDGFDMNKYEVYPFLISKNGYFIDTKTSLEILQGKSENELLKNRNFGVQLGDPIVELLKIDIDIFFPVVHGNLGEDGTLQGLFRLLQKPYIGADLKGHAISFDKVITKELLTYNGIPNTKYIVINKQDKTFPSWNEITNQLGKIVFVKAANQGSSVGISRVTNENEYQKALSDSFNYDEKILVEQNIDGAFEVEVGLIGNDELQISMVGSHRAPGQGDGDGWFDYNNKFVDNSKMKYDIPAKLSESQINQIQEISKKAMRILNIKGLARMDFLLDSNGNIFLGEPNTLPGFTNMSLFQVLWETSGMNRTKLIDTLIELAIEEFNRKQNISYSFKELSDEKLGNFKFDGK